MPKKKEIKYYEGLGRRKEAVARVRLYIIPPKQEKIEIDGLSIKRGEIYVNKKKIADYFPGLVAKTKYLLPLKLTECEDRFAISILAKGGGKKGQLDAVVLGMARALLLVNPEYRPILKKHKLLTRDPRERERRKVGTGGKARREKQSPKR